VRHPDPERLALAALPAEPPDPLVEEHLRECPLCRGHVESLRRAVDLAVGGRGDGLEYADPPERVWRAITGELDRPGPRPRWHRLAAPVAAAVLALAAGIGIGHATGAAPPAERPAAVLAAVDGAPGPSGSVATARVDGREVLVVRVRGVVLPPGSDHLEAWLMDATGTRLVGLGSLARDGDGFRGAFPVPVGLPPAVFGRVDVSAERWDGDERHSRTSLLRGPLA
jgi:anti-sigma factor RsiW